MSSSNRALKILVVFLGLVLLFGMIALFAAIAIKYRDKQAERCAHVSLQMPKDTEIVGMSRREEDAVELLVKTGAETWLIRYDLCTGQPVERIAVQAR